MRSALEREKFDAPARQGSRGESAFPRSRPLKARRDRDAAALDPTIGFLASSGLHPATLAAATAQARQLGVTADAALLATGAVSEDDFYRAFARHIGASFVTSGVRLAPGLDHASAVTAGVAPLHRWPGGPRFLAAPRGAAIAAFLARPDPGALVITTPRRFEAFLRDASGDRIATEAATTLDAIAPNGSARRLFSPATLPAVAILAAATTLVVWLDGGIARALLFTALWLCFAVACTHRIHACFASCDSPPPAPPLEERDLPAYTVIVALYKESRVARDLVAALRRLDYPPLGSNLTCQKDRRRRGR